MLALTAGAFDLWLVVQSPKYSGNCSYADWYECQSTADLAIKGTADVTLIRKSSIIFISSMLTLSFNIIVLCFTFIYSISITHSKTTCCACCGCYACKESLNSISDSSLAAQSQFMGIQLSGKCNNKMMISSQFFKLMTK